MEKDKLKQKRRNRKKQIKAVFNWDDNNCRVFTMAENYTT